MIHHLHSYNSGRGSISSEPTNIRPYTLFSFICGFNGNNNLMLYIEQKFKEKRYSLINNSIIDLCKWENIGYYLLNLNYNNFNSIDSNNLRLVLLFR